MADILRGSSSIEDQELMAHIAMALRLENVAVLLGSGASVVAGGETISGLWNGLREREGPALDAMAEAGFFEHGTTPNIEELIGCLEIAIADGTRRGEDTALIAGWRNVLRRAVIRAARLSEELWQHRATKESHRLLTPYLRMLAKLQASRQPGQSAPWMFTTNYDLTVEWAAEGVGLHLVNGFIGLHDRKFQSNAFDLNLKNAFATGEARFGSYNLNLIKVHGSLNWIVKDDGDVQEVSCQAVNERLKEYVDGAAEDFPSLMIHPSAAKYLDTAGFIYGELVRRFTDFLSRPNSVLLVVGYGFNDAHINSVIASGLLNPTLQLIIYYPEFHQLVGTTANEFINQILRLGLPRVIIRGGGPAAYFDRFVAELPDPALVDELSPEIRRLLLQWARNAPGDAA